MLIILLLTTIMSSLFSGIRSDFDIKRLRLKNGATVIYSPTSWGGQSKVAAVFLKNGGTLKFNKKSGFASMAQGVISSRLKKLSMEVGFRYRSHIDWDYLVFMLYLPPALTPDELAGIWGAFYDGRDVTYAEFQAARDGVLASIRRDLDHKVISFPIISFMVNHRSAYSVGVHGSQEDVNSSTPEEISEFMRCYVNPSNSLVVSAAEKNIYRFVKGIESFKPCFRDKRFEDSGIVDLNDPGRSVNYIRSEKKSSIIRLGFPANSCDRKESVFYDLAAKVLMQDDVINGLSAHVSVSNQCYINKGVLEIVLFDVKKDADEVTSRLLQRIKFLSAGIDAAFLEHAKTELLKDLMSMFNEQDSFVYMLGKAQISSGNYENLLDYKKRVNAVSLPEIKKALGNISDEDMYKMYIKLER